MNFNYSLPKLNADRGALITTPVAGDTALATGVLSLKDEAGVVNAEIPISAITGWGYDAYAAGTAHAVDVDYTGGTLVGNTQYALTVHLPYLINFFGGGQETRAIYVTRTYKVGVDATPTPTELAALFEARIAEDQYAAFSGSAAAGVLTITADSAEAGAMEVSTTVVGATVADATPWVSPVGSVTEVNGELNVNAAGAGYNRYIIEYNKPIRHNAVKGQFVIKSEKFVYYIDKDDAGTAAAVTLLTSILDGSYATVADYLGAPSF